MNRDQAIALIKRIEPAIRAMGVTALYLFGSTARNEAKPTSDVDIFFERDLTRKFSFIELGRMERLLEGALETKVDLAPRECLHPVLKADIERSAIRVL